MSFDSTFDYSAAKGFLDTAISTNQARATSFQDKIDELAAITGYADRISAATAQYTAQKSVFDDQVARYQAVKDEILAVEALDAGDKQNLYDFYVLAQEPLNTYMARILFNHAAILADADLAAVLADGTNNADQKRRVAELICLAYSIDPRTGEAATQFPTA